MPPSIDVLTSSSAPAWPTALMALKSPLPSPNVMVPKQSFETRRPVLPSVAYCMALSFLVSPTFSFGKVSVVGMGTCPPKWRPLRIWLEASGRLGGAVDTERDRWASNSVRRRALLHSDQDMTELILSIVRYCPWLTSTLPHARESLARFSLRQARMVKS